VLEFFQAHIWILPLALILALIPPIHSALRRRRQRQAEEEILQIKRRNEALSEAIRNPLAEEKRNGGEEAVEIVWDEKAVNDGPKKAELMAELVELSGYSRRKYVFQVNQPIRIGSAPDNRMVLQRDGVQPVHCEIFMNNGAPCVRGASGAKTVLRRGGKLVRVGKDGIYLKNGDHIQLGAVDIQFRLFKA